MEDLVILMGSAGAGKTVQGQRLASELGWTHLSTGVLLRADATRAAQLATGKLTPPSEVERVLEQSVYAAAPDRTIVLDGFPRMVDQAEWLDGQLRVWKRAIKQVLLLEVSPEVSHSRLSARGRTDDTPAAQAVKQSAYELETKPVLDYYESRGLLHRIDGHGTKDEVYSRITKVFNV